MWNSFLFHLDIISNKNSKNQNILFIVHWNIQLVEFLLQLHDCNKNIEPKTTIKYLCLLFSTFIVSLTVIVLQLTNSF